MLAPLRKLGKPIEDTIRAQDYVAIQRSGDYTDARNNGEYLKAGFITGYTAGLMDAVFDGFQPDPERGTYSSTSTRAAPSAGSRRTRPLPASSPTLEIFALVSWDLATDGKRHVDYVKDYWSKLLPFTDGYYTNEVTDELQPKVDENYRGTSDACVNSSANTTRRTCSG